MSEPLSEALQSAFATQEEYHLPSIFEIIAEENLRISVRPAFEYLIKVLCNNHPVRFGWLIAWYDECFTLVELLVQHHFLLAHIASYSEMYYGLRRKIKGLKVLSHSQLDNRRHYMSLITLCIIPYIEIKLKKIYDKILEKYEETRSTRNLTIIGKFIYWIYPYLTSSWEFWRLYLLFNYAIHNNKYPDPFLKLMRVKLVVEDPNVASQASGNLVSRFFTRLISVGVHTGVFLLQFVEWWYNDASQETVTKLIQNPIPPPPPDAVNTLIPAVDDVACPLCKRRRTNDTAVLTSGYVFCYVCIHKYVKANKRCPVTGFPSELCHLMKLYLPE